MANARIMLRRGRAYLWTQENPLLELGEPGYETDTKRMKIGDGKTEWNRLPYWSAGEAVDIQVFQTMLAEQLDEHVNSLAPHPVYDDGPSLVLLYENAKV